MKTACLVILLGGTLGAQSLVEYSGAAAGGAAGGVAGKKVSDGLTGIFNKVDKATAKAADDKAPAKDKNAPLFDVGPGVPHSHGGGSSSPSGGSATAPAKPTHSEAGSVPPPPAVHHAAVRKPAAPRAEPDPVPEPIPPPPPPPPPVATAADLRAIAVGTGREDVLKLGDPAARIMMYDDGHLIEIYRYLSKDTDIGVVRLSDGTVSSVRVN